MADPKSLELDRVKEALKVLESEGIVKCTMNGETSTSTGLKKRLSDGSNVSSGGSSGYLGGGSSSSGSSSQRSR